MFFFPRHISSNQLIILLTEKNLFIALQVSKKWRDLINGSLGEILVWKVHTFSVLKVHKALTHRNYGEEKLSDGIASWKLLAKILSTISSFELTESYQHKI